MKRKKINSSKQQFHTRFHVKDGQHLKEIDPSSKDWAGNDTCIFYPIAREEIEACDTTRLLHDLRTEIGNPLFKAGPGSVFFSVNGYGEDPRDLLQIPEFRSFARKLQQSSICWLYFAMPGNSWLRIILVASTADCPLVAEGGKLRIAIANAQVAEFMEHQLREYAGLLEQRGMKWNGSDYHVKESMNDSFPGFLSPPWNN